MRTPIGPWPYRAQQSHQWLFASKLFPLLVLAKLSSPLRRSPLSPRAPSRWLFLALLCCWLFSGFLAGWPPAGMSLAVPAAHAADLTYIYDELGRLVAVVNASSGEAAI